MVEVCDDTFKNCHEAPGIIRTITTTIHNVMSIKITVLRFTTLRTTPQKRNNNLTEIDECHKISNCDTRTKIYLLTLIIFIILLLGKAFYEPT